MNLIDDWFIDDWENSQQDTEDCDEAWFTNNNNAKLHYAQHVASSPSERLQLTNLKFPFNKTIEEYRKDAHDLTMASCTIEVLNKLDVECLPVEKGGVAGWITNKNCPPGEPRYIKMRFNPPTYRKLMDYNRFYMVETVVYSIPKNGRPSSIISYMLSSSDKPARECNYFVAPLPESELHPIKDSNDDPLGGQPVSKFA